MPPLGALANRQKLLAAGAVVLLAAIAFFALRDWMAYRRLGEENDQLRQRLAEAQRRKEVDLPKARERLIALEDEQDEFHYRERLPEEDRLEELFDRLSDFEQASQVDWQGSRSSESRVNRQRTGPDSHERLQYSLELTGEFYHFCRFVNLLESMTRLVTIDEFTVKRVTKDAEDQEKLLCDIKLTFSVYTLKPVAPPAAPAASGTPRLRTARS